MLVKVLALSHKRVSTNDHNGGKKNYVLYIYRNDFRLYVIFKSEI